MFSAHIKNSLSLYLKSSFRGSSFRASVAALLICVGVAAMASAFQRRGPHKLRAMGLIEVTRDSGGRVSAVLTPITILDKGRFQDASIYKSRPQPMALESGIVYEAQKTGIPVGYVTLDNAQIKNNIWLAEGTWQAAPQPSDRVPAAKNAQTPSPSAGNSNSGDDRPILHRSGNSQPAPPSTPSPSPSSVSPKAPPASPPPEPESEPQDPDRPVLRRHKPSAEPLPAATPTPRATSAGPQTSSRPAPGPTPVANTPGAQVLTGVSDAEPTETRSYEFNWGPKEKEQIEAKIRKLALDQLPGVKTQVNQPALTNVVIRSFDVDLSNDAVVVLTAEVPGGYLATEAPSNPKSPTPGAQKGRTATPSRKTSPAADENPQAKFVSRFITVIARLDTEGNPQKLAASVTDSSRLDVAPRLELIDAVDVDGDGLAELLFREYSFDQKSFIVYGIGHGTVTKVFEGASQPLH